jgi:hypothetical protein
VASQHSGAMHYDTGVLIDGWMVTDLSTKI